MSRVRVTVILAALACGRTSTPLSDTTFRIDSSAAVPAVLSSTAAVESTVARPASAPLNAELAVLRRELIIPVADVVAGELRDTFTEARSGGRVHDAIDIPAPRGTHVLSASPGRVLKLFTSKAGGLMVYAADSTEGFILLYAHLDGYAPGLADGSALFRGETIGFVGTTGNAPPNLPHLHFAIEKSADISKWWQGTAVNPYPLLRNK